MNKEQKRVLVIGGGIAGLTAARKLSQAGLGVELVEKAHFLGGHGIQYACKATDKCQQCGACAVESTLKTVTADSNINIHLNTVIEKVDANGKFEVKLKSTQSEQPETGEDSGGCADNYAHDPQACASARGYSRLNQKLCTPEERFSTAKNPATQKVVVDALLLATGFTPFDPGQKPTYRHGELKNVVSGLELERDKRVNGAVLRPSDGAAPQKIAFIQCVGSRDERLGNLWCSRVCCPYALRSAQRIKHENPEADITIFYMDIQNTGNNFSEFYEKCKSEFRFIRTIPVDMYLTDDDKVRTRYMIETDGTPVDEEFDLVVLSIGIMPTPGNNPLSEILGIDLDTDGFFKGASTSCSSQTEHNGIFLAGTVKGPKTIADTMAHAGASACDVMNYLGGAK